MVLPIGDDNSDRRATPVVNYGLIAVNVLVFVFLQGLGANDGFTYAFSTVPEEILTGKDEVTEDHELVDPITGRAVVDPYTGQPVVQPGLRPTPGSVYLTLLTSMFMHGGVAHLLGNMLFLWIFGDNLEDYLGHVRYLVFYLVCGVLASLAHVGATAALHRDLLTPSLGASGAISGVLGAYLLLFPRRRVTVVLFQVLTQVPSWVAIGMWFVFQIVSAVGVLGEGSQIGGVAYAAHVGGFVAGLALVKLFALGRPPPREPRPFRPRTRAPW
jgi:membrane associated rhomboid family serine protease